MYGERMQMDSLVLEKVSTLVYAHVILSLVVSISATVIN